jgi:hypothetical protein
MKEKMTAASALAGNMKGVPKIPALITKAFDQMKSDLLEVSNSVQKIDQEKDTLQKNSEACSADSLDDPVKCYEKIFGKIHCSPEDRKEWDTRMGKKF